MARAKAAEKPDSYLLDQSTPELQMVIRQIAAGRDVNPADFCNGIALKYLEAHTHEGVAQELLAPNGFKAAFDWWTARSYSWL